MRGYWRVALGFAILAALVFSENLFGREFNRLFLLLPGVDKVLHATEYFAISVLIFWLTGRVDHDMRHRAAVACAAGVLLAFADEFTQRLVTDRNFELLDLAANLAGLTLGWVVTARPRLPLAAPAALAALATVGYVAYGTHVQLSDWAKALQHERRFEFAQAREYYLRAIAKGLRNPSVYNELAWVSVEGRAGAPEEAVGYARMAYEAEPGNPDILDTYGWALHHAGRSREALPYLQAAFERNPEMYCIHYHLGATYAALSQPDLAERHFRAQMALQETREARMAAEALAALKSGVAADSVSR
jgi:tetratricopeptide (TPR) repeat protein